MINRKCVLYCFNKYTTPLSDEEREKVLLTQDYFSERPNIREICYVTELNTYKIGEM